MIIKSRKLRLSYRLQVLIRSRRIQKFSPSILKMPSHCQAKRNAFPLPASPAIAIRKSRGWIKNHHNSNHVQPFVAGKFVIENLLVIFSFYQETKLLPSLSKPISRHWQAFYSLPEDSSKWHGYAQNTPSAKNLSTQPNLSAPFSNTLAAADPVPPTPTAENS